MSRVFIGVGSNQGERLECISRALQALNAVPGIRVVQMATILETEPVGLPAPRRFTGIYYVYAMTCEDGSVYIGQTDDLLRRWQDHLNGRVEWTARRRPITIAHFEVLSTRREAVEREKSLKTGYGRAWLHQLIDSGRARQAGGPPQGPYLNTAAELQTTLTPRELLTTLQGIERRLGRTPSPQRWTPRPIDLDILLYDDQIVAEPDLVIPHPRMHERRFVLEPLGQLAPDFAHPILGRTIAALLEDMSVPSTVPLPV